MSGSARKLTEVALQTTRMFPIAGDAVWGKTGIQEVLPGQTEFWSFQTPTRTKLILDEVVVRPVDPISYQFGDFAILVSGAEYRRVGEIFRPADSEFAREMEYPDKVWMEGGGGGPLPFQLRFRSTSNVFAVTFDVSLRIFLERTAN